MPATLETIKRQAKRIKKASPEPMKHAAALEVSARNAGFDNYRAAYNYWLRRSIGASSDPL